MEAEFGVDGAIAKCGHRSEAMKQLDVLMHYNYNLWMVHYLNHLDSIETLHNIGDPTELGFMEMQEFVPVADIYSSMQQEIGNLAP